LSLTDPLPRRQGASSFLRAAARANVLPGLRRGARSRHHGRSIPAALGSQPPRGKSSRGPFFFCTRARIPASPYTALARVILSGAIYETRLFRALVELGS